MTKNKMMDRFQVRNNVLLATILYLKNIVYIKLVGEFKKSVIDVLSLF